MLQTRKANPNKPPRIMIYGPEGVGKSTFGAKATRPIFIGAEGGSDQLTDSDGSPVEEMPDIVSWERLRGAVDDLIEQDHNFKTAVFDSADWIEGLCHQKIIGTTKKTISTVNGGYGAGYREAQNMHQDLIRAIDTLRINRDMNIIVIAHAHVKNVKDPESTYDYDSFEIKCHEMVSSLWREYVDALLFARFRTFTKSSDDTQKARAMTDGSRVVYTVKQPAFQAKNRFGLPPEMNFTEDFWSEFLTYTRKGALPETLNDILSEVQTLRSYLTDPKTLEAVDMTIQKAQDIPSMIAIRERLKQITGKVA